MLDMLDLQRRRVDAWADATAAVKARAGTTPPHPDGREWTAADHEWFAKFTAWNVGEHEKTLREVRSRLASMEAAAA